VYAHLDTLRFPYFPVWGPTILFNDVALVLIIRFLTGKNARIWMTLIAWFLSVDLLVAASASISFRLVTKNELHWRSLLKFPRDAAGFNTLLSGSATTLAVSASILLASGLLAPAIYNITRVIVDSIIASIKHVLGFVTNMASSQHYHRLEHDVEFQTTNSNTDGQSLAEPLLKTERAARNDDQPVKGTKPTLNQLVISLLMAILSLLWVLQPPHAAYVHLSPTLPIIPFNFWGSWRRDVGIEIARMVDICRISLEGKGAYIPAPAASRSYEEYKPNLADGTETWELDGRVDPLHISNMGADIVKPLQKTLAGNDVNIKHILLIKLESTRDDMFPLREGSYVWDKIQKAYDYRVPDDVVEKLANVTRNAARLSGRRGIGSDSSVQHRGGLTFNDAATASTYTIKSLIGTLCGVAPLAVDYHQERNNRYYQQCYPQIFEVLDRKSLKKNEDFRSWGWKSMFMQSVTYTYDHKEQLFSKLGYKDGTVITKEVLDDPKSPFYPPKGEEVNYYGYADDELRGYFRKAFVDAEKNQERLFLVHQTGTTHHPWGVPGGRYEEFLNGLSSKQDRDTNRYINAIGYVDNWLGELLEIMEEIGVANETLTICVGDHGIGVPFDGSPTPYNNPHISNIHVPLVFSHPRLPSVEIDAPVISSQILPSIMDLLVSSSSLDETGSASLRALQSRYEGQSLIRPQFLRRPSTKPRVPSNDKKNRSMPPSSDDKPAQRNWQFTVLNPGGSTISVRDATRPYRLTLPLATGFEWQFHDLAQDPIGNDIVRRLDPVDLIGYISGKYGEDVVSWIGQASEVTSWWWRENWRRYRYSGDGTTKKP
jgi:hypothetical protein